MHGQVDLIVRGGLIANGLDETLVEGDVAVHQGRIVEVGKTSARAREVIDARGLMVTPGFVDIHTHYDGQAVWDRSLAPSSWHGVTTAVMGNCGVGFAPVKASDRDDLIELMEGVEDIPGAALHHGLDWKWQSFSEFLDALERTPHDIDFCAQLPHAALRVFVMGSRAIRLEPATAEDCAQMRSLAADAMRAGALGFSTSRSINHKSLKGAPTPTLKASEQELLQISLGLKDAGCGVLQMITDFDDADVDGEFGLMKRMAQQSGRPLSFSLMQKHSNVDGWRRVLALTDQAVREGLAMRAQVAPRGVGVLLGLMASRTPFSECPSYKRIARLPFEERVALWRTPALHDALMAEMQASSQTPLGRRLTEFDNIFVFGQSLDYDPGARQSIAAIAGRTGRASAEVAYELLGENEGRNFLYSPFANYADKNLDVCAEMLAHPWTLSGLGDGGAHVGVISDANFPTYILSYWGKSQQRFSLPWLVKRLSSDNARAVGLLDRGVIAPGMKADLNLIDVDKLGLEMPHIQADLPAGGRRLMQRATGYAATIVSGRVTYRHGQPTGELPGWLVRGAR
ncbi:N-acyl-D-amino-acid deacylase family protein [Pseudorhodoferax sp.]|uniref:N-acyl-D-amino-acid deacylase family protein n=1 Tax=Pseudorhodoferax sp. TaxID=1993553 RepID=UPI002DD656F5|nr:amidohydrolase family protein [Pseudorhodoferax sp.]